MSTNIYARRKEQQRVEESKQFAGGFPLEAEIEPGMESWTLRQLGLRLQQQMSERGAIGIKLIEIRFAMIFNPPEDIKERR